jgi:hypothetical protein
VSASTHPARRILLCEVCEDGTAGGSHQALFDLARGLDPGRYVPLVVFYQENRFVAPLRDLGAEVQVWEAERRQEREPFLRQGGAFRKVTALLAGVRRRVRVLREREVALVHINNGPTVGHDDWLPAAHWLGIPCIATVMGRPYELSDAWRRRLMMRRHDQLISISHHVHESLLEGGYPEDRVTEIPLGIDIEAFLARVDRAPAAVRESLGIPAERMLVAMVGNLQPWERASVARDRSRRRRAPDISIILPARAPASALAARGRAGQS